MTEATGATQRERVAVVAHGASDVGCERDGNEDAWLIGDLDAGAALS